MTIKECCNPTQHMISSHINFLGNNCFKSSEAGDISLGWYDQGRLYKKLAFELDFEKLSDLPDGNNLSLH